ncbi:MAG: 50S ribosomal protein L30e [Candidatus Bathyarchaeota archaeon]
MSDVNKAISLAVKTGKVTFGFKSTLGSIRSGKAKLIVLASNCPEQNKKEISNLSNISNIQIFQCENSSQDLGSICGKRFPVTAMVVGGVSESDLLKKLAKVENVE